MLEAIIILAALVAVNVVFGIIKRKAEQPARQVEETTLPPVEQKKVG